jgi:hypothetical protein
MQLQKEILTKEEKYKKRLEMFEKKLRESIK